MSLISSLFRSAPQRAEHPHNLAGSAASAASTAALAKEAHHDALDIKKEVRRIAEPATKLIEARQLKAAAFRGAPVPGFQVDDKTLVIAAPGRKSITGAALIGVLMDRNVGLLIDLTSKDERRSGDPLRNGGSIKLSNTLAQVALTTAGQPGLAEGGRRLMLKDRQSGICYAPARALITSANAGRPGAHYAHDLTLLEAPIRSAKAGLSLKDLTYLADRIRQYRADHPDRSVAIRCDDGLASASQLHIAEALRGPNAPAERRAIRDWLTQNACAAKNLAGAGAAPRTAHLETLGVLARAQAPTVPFKLPRPQLTVVPKAHVAPQPRPAPASFTSPAEEAAALPSRQRRADASATPPLPPQSNRQPPTRYEPPPAPPLPPARALPERPTSARPGSGDSAATAATAASAGASPAVSSPPVLDPRTTMLDELRAITATRREALDGPDAPEHVGPAGMEGSATLPMPSHTRPLPPLPRSLSAGAASASDQAATTRTQPPPAPPLPPGGLMSGRPTPPLRRPESTSSHASSDSAPSTGSSPGSAPGSPVAPSLSSSQADLQTELRARLASRRISMEGGEPVAGPRPLPMDGNATFPHPARSRAADSAEAVVMREGRGRVAAISLPSTRQSLPANAATATVYQQPWGDNNSLIDELAAVLRQRSSRPPQDAAAQEPGTPPPAEATSLRRTPPPVAPKPARPDGSRPVSTDSPDRGAGPAGHAQA